jgi:type I restriction enzyme S subunit
VLSAATVRLADVTTRIGSGITPRGGSTVYKASGRPFLRSQNIGWGDLRLDDIVYIDEATHSTFLATEVRTGDVLLNITGSIGRSAVATPELDGGNVSQHVCVIRLKPGRMDPYFVNAFLLSRAGQDQIKMFQAGGTRQGLNFQQVRSISVPDLPISQQRAIGAAGRDADDLISALERKIAKKQAIMRGMMQQLLTGKTRLAGFTGPWRDVLLGDHVNYVRSVALSRAQLDNQSPVRYLHYGDIHTRSIAKLNAANEPMPRASEVLLGNAGRLQVGDVVFADASEDLDGVGKSVEITAVPNAGVVAGLHTIAARFDQNVLANGFKAYLQFIPAFRQALLRRAAGTKVLAITRSFISSVTISLPDVDEQRAIAVVLDDAAAEIAQLEARLVKAQAIKQGMMQELLTGRTRLPVVEGAA